MKFYKICWLLLFLSCQKFVTKTDHEYFYEIPVDSKKEFLTIAFSHNINGELEPCGCRQFPLGGIPQIAGTLNELKNQGSLIWVDAGDTFFPNTIIPSGMHESYHLMANQLSKNLTELGLNIFVPGEQDLADSKWLSQLSQGSSFSFLMSNYQDHLFKHLKRIDVKWGERNIVFFSYLNPDIFESKIKTQNIHYLKKLIDEIDDENEIILISHSGLEHDEGLAKEIPKIDWIIGSHSQSFLRSPKMIGQTKIVQVLSKNHYLGTIKIPWDSKQNPEYKIIEIRDEFKNKLQPNKYVSEIIEFRSELKKVQEKESNNMVISNKTQKKIPHVNSCVECHKDQVTFWQKTPHSLAYFTLSQKKAEFNPECIKCHSVGFKKPEGFYNHQSLVLTENLTPVDKTYWKKIKELESKVKVIKEMNPNDLKMVNQHWLKLDSDHKIQHNFANVQCYNCHIKSIDHPFEMGEKSTKVSTNTCLSCHTQDQSPDWYKKGTNQIETLVVKNKFLKVSCPKGSL